MNKYANKIIITTGDPNGIGAEITIKALNLLNLPSKDIVIVSNSKVLNYYGHLSNNYEICEIDFDGVIVPGKVAANAGDFAFRCLQKACEMNPKYIVTAPTSKEAMNLAGYHYNGQTEVLEKFLAKENQKAEMLFVSKDFRVLLLTRHCALKDVSNLFTKEMIFEKIERLRSFFQNKLNIKKPKFAICGLNPHAGENGLLGEEEKNIILPAIEMIRNRGIDITNPIPADALFSQAIEAYIKGEKMTYDCYVACYHDQGLIPIKAIAGKNTVNMTIGLNVIRTSPSHGTAFDIAGKNIADSSSMQEAIKYCLY